MTNPPCPIPLKIHPPRASSIIVHHVPTDRTDTFLHWERAITSAAACFPGYQASEAYPPSNPAIQEWVVIMHFDDAQSLEAWLHSPERARWMSRLPAESRGFQVKTLPSGLGEWFLHLPAAAHPLPHWKAFLAVLLALYPTVMLFGMFVSPYLQPLGVPLAMLIANTASVSFLEYLAMPRLSKAMAPWLEANDAHNKRTSYLGLVLILAALAAMTALFNIFY